MQTLETGRQGLIFELDLVRETCAGSEHKDIFSEHEDHKPPTHDGGPPTFAKEAGNHNSYPTFATEALKTNVLIWGSFMSPSMNAAIHLGPN